MRRMRILHRDGWRRRDDRRERGPLPSSSSSSSSFLLINQQRQIWSGQPPSPPLLSPLPPPTCTHAPRPDQLHAVYGVCMVCLVVNDTARIVPGPEPPESDGCTVCTVVRSSWGKPPPSGSAMPVSRVLGAAIPEQRPRDPSRARARCKGARRLADGRTTVGLLPPAQSESYPEAPVKTMKGSCEHSTGIGGRHRGRVLLLVNGGA